MNKVTLIGTINHGFITTIRTSGVDDTIPISTLQEGRYKICGTLHTYNTPERHLKLYVQPDSITPSQEPSTNEITLSGYICKTPIIRTTPAGRTITDLLIVDPDNNAYIPCVAWGNNARKLAQLNISDPITIRGRIQSRTYQKQDAPHTTYEISIDFYTNQT